MATRDGLSLRWWLGSLASVTLGLAGAVLALGLSRPDSAVLSAALGLSVGGLFWQASRRHRLQVECDDFGAYHRRSQSENIRRQDELEQEVERRHEAEMRLRQSQERLRLLLGNLPIIVFTLDPEGRVSLLEGRGLEVLDTPAEQFIGLHFAGLFPEDKDLAMIVERVLSGQPQRADVSRDELALEIHLQPLFSELGFPDGAAGVAVDIRERAQVDQLKREFIASVTHELRTPLTSIIGALGLLSGGALGELPEGAQRMLSIARDNSERLLRLINDILDLDKVDAGRLVFHFRATELKPLLEQTIESHGPYAAEFGVYLELLDETHEQCVLGDADRLLQVLSNLLSNAIKHTPEGGRVVLHCHRQSERIIVEVQDEGPGVPEEARGYLFERFTPAAATGRGGGSGLGLSIARAIVERHGGHLDYRNREGGGAVFHFDLPRCPCDTAPFSSTGQSPAS